MRNKIKIFFIIYLFCLAELKFLLRIGNSFFTRNTFSIWGNRDYLQNILTIIQINGCGEITGRGRSDYILRRVSYNNHNSVALGFPRYDQDIAVNYLLIFWSIQY